MTNLIFSCSVCVLSLVIAFQAWYFRNFSVVLMRLIAELQCLKAEAIHQSSECACKGTLSEPNEIDQTAPKQSIRPVQDFSDGR
uniref:Uncharacterized protein n=1 Tax=Podoviridae sp. ctrub15 TaxID=2826581 RepID=A0A8S5LUN5_9CAUD|nr:MAG TPA: hypothetical protein [Podoviridae sp. ctrub15]